MIRMHQMVIVDSLFNSCSFQYLTAFFKKQIENTVHRKHCTPPDFLKISFLFTNSHAVLKDLSHMTHVAGRHLTSKEKASFKKKK